MSTEQPSRTWQEITAEACREKDPRRLRELSDELERALEDRDKHLHKPTGKAYRGKRAGRTRLRPRSGTPSRQS
jgi:hypothetical protein